MASILLGTLPWHDGEKRMHDLLRVPTADNPTVPRLSPGAGFLLQRSPLLAIGAIDHQGRPWSTVWGGQVGFATPISPSSIDIKTPIDGKYDPVADIFLRNDQGDEFSNLFSGLIVDLEHRLRAKLHGHKVSGSLDKNNGSGTAHLRVDIDACLGNCPKYINIKHIEPAVPEPKLISDSAQLPSGAVDLLGRADCLFVSSRREAIDMDTNIRGGPPGFVRLISNESSGAVFAYPEYSGNRLYQTLGNLQTTPLAGYVFPDFETGNVLHVTGKTEVLVGKEAAALLPRSNLAVRVAVTAARYIEKALSFRGIAGDPSPYNPPVRHLATEGPAIAGLNDERPLVTATMVKKEIITPTIARFRFRISDPAKLGTWTPGQYATFSFHDELDLGYHHMLDDDPTSLNDDYVRTFTITSYPGKGNAASELEITARRKGNVTNYLFRTYEGAGLEVPLLGFGGDFQLKTPDEQTILPFVAGGIGITPVIAQLPYIDIQQLRLLWTISVQDIGLALDLFHRFPQLPRSTTLFVTGSDAQRGQAKQKLETATSLGASVQYRRIEAHDLDLSLGETWFFCGGPSLKASVLNWLTGKRVIYEDFSY